jgi:hypothetical protein
MDAQNRCAAIWQMDVPKLLDLQVRLRIHFVNNLLRLDDRKSLKVYTDELTGITQLKCLAGVFETHGEHRTGSLNYDYCKQMNNMVDIFYRYKGYTTFQSQRQIKNGKW